MLGCTPDSSPPGGFCSRHYRQGTESDFKSTEVRDFPGDPVAETLSSQHRGPGFDPQSLVAQLVKNLSTMQETWVQSLGWEDFLEKGKATHSSILAWRIPWTI